MPYTIPVMSPDIPAYVLDEGEFILDVVSEEDEEEAASETEDEEEEEEYVPITTTNARISPNTRLNPARRIVFDEEEQQAQISHTHDQSREQGEASTSSSKKAENDGVISSGNESDGVCCPICMEFWSSEGRHQVCCLPCGHVYGFSCIEKWIRQCGRNSAKCPQCSRKCNLKDIIKLYVSRVAVIDGEQQKKVLSLQAENEFLKLKIANLQEKICQNEEEKMCIEEVNCFDNVAGEMRTRNSEFIATVGDLQGQIPSGYGGQGLSSCNFALEDEFVVVGARIFDINASNRVLLLARRLPGSGGDYVLTKISLMYPYDSENIQLPPSTKAVKDVHISPCAGRLALFSSLGKKLSILSMESNNVVLTYNLPGPAWSCSWDLNSQHHVYAGLQNGTLLVFDIRQTAGPLEYINGLSSHPLHTLHSLAHHNSSTPDVRTLLTASSIGPCVWNTGAVGQRCMSFVVPEMENQGVCVSLAYSPSSDDIVASFRPKVQTSSDTIYTQATQPLVSPTPTAHGRGILGSHVLLKRVGGGNSYQKLGSCPANVNDVRMFKSAIVNIENCNPLFACGDEATRGVSLYDLPSLRVMQTLESHANPILDVKFAPSLGILGYTSEDKLQLYSAKFS